MITKRKILISFVCFGSLSLFAALLLPALARPSNCGRNSYALYACREIALHIQLAAATNGPVIDLSVIDYSDQTNLFRTANSHWTTGADYWVRTNNRVEMTQKQIIVVCDIAYDNVPQPTLWNFYHRNPAHAVGFSDGTTGLISPVEFTRMDHKSFLNLSALGRANQP